MAKGLSKVKRLKTPAEAREEFRRTGQSVAAWARKHGFCDVVVRLILAGKRPGHRGQSHKIAVMLGIKDGVIEDDTDKD